MRMLTRSFQWLPTFGRGLLLVLGCLTFAAIGRAADEVRFSATLSESQRKETGLAQLTEDNVAVIDALVRQDEATLKRRGTLSSFGSFSQRRSEN